MAAGAKVPARLDSLGALPVGGAVVTPGGALPAPSSSTLVQAPKRSRMTALRCSGPCVNGLRRAREWGIGSLALPPLGTGAGNLEAEEAARVPGRGPGDHLEGEAAAPGLDSWWQTPYEEELFRARPVAIAEPASR